MVDGDANTGWQPASGKSDGAWIELRWPTTIDLVSIDVLSGDPRRDGHGDHFDGVGQMTRAKITFADGAAEEIVVAPGRREFQTITFAAPHRSDRLRLEVLAFDGAPAKGFAIAELRVRAPTPP
jgi:hypothetical protein